MISKVWSRIYPRGLQLSVLLAYLPSIASIVEYQNMDKPFNKNTQFGRTLVKVKSYYAIIITLRIGKNVPIIVSKFGASLIGNIDAIKFQYGSNTTLSIKVSLLVEYL